MIVQAIGKTSEMDRDRVGLADTPLLVAAIAILVAIACFCLPSSAGAATVPQPSWTISASAYPTNFEPGLSGTARLGPGLYIYAKNVGAEETTGAYTFTVALPPGLEATGSEQVRGNTFYQETLTCTAAAQIAECTSEVPLHPGQWVWMRLGVTVTMSAQSGEDATSTIEGGGAAASSTVTPISIGDSLPSFGFQAGEAGLTFAAQDEAGDAVTSAGSHPYEVNLHFRVPWREAAENIIGVESPRTVSTELPRGLIVDPEAIPKCSDALFEGLVASLDACPPASQIGTVMLETDFGTDGIRPITDPLYNLVPAPGVPAEFGFEALDGLPPYIHIRGGVRSDGDYGLSSLTSEILARPYNPILGLDVTLWGSPTDESHDWARARCSELVQSCPSERLNSAALTMPSSCSGDGLSLTVGANTWEMPNSVVTRTAAAPEVAGCNQLEFAPMISSKPTTNHADSPTGLDFDLHQPQDGSYEGRSPAILKDATVGLPAGVAINPSGANGLAACTPAEIGLLTPVGQPEPVHTSKQPQTCPDAAKIGTVEISTPLLDHKLPGAVYAAKPYDNPFNSLLAIYLAVEDEESGIIAKLAGKVEPDPITGQLTARFTENPELPIEDIGLHFFAGARAVLKTPFTCGTAVTSSDLTPWSTPEGADAHPSDSFSTSVAASGSGACPSSEAAAPNAPTFSAGTQSPVAGSFTPFLLKLSRADGSQHITGIDTTLPEGLLGKLAGIPYCSDSAIALARSREAPEQGKLEQASSSCPVASEVGTVQVGAGAGITPLYVTGHVYLAGPYKGAPLSLAIITPAVAGPFDLGNVVTRVALNVDPYSAQINAVSDPLPTIIQGIPLDIRSITLKLDRPGFTLNPTSCESMAITGNATTQSGQIAALRNSFQVGGCKSLAFKPSLKLSLKGATKRSGHPALKAVLTYPTKGAYANIAKAQVGLPHSEFLDQGNLNNVCTQSQLKTQTCPAKSIYGRVKAWTPLLEKPLEGPVYLGVGFGHKLPDLVAELNGQLRVLLHGKVDTDKKGGIRNTFETVPDAPVTKFVLELQGGKKKGLLENSENICRKTQKAEVAFTAQSGKVASLSPKIGNSCGGKGKKHKGHKKGNKKPGPKHKGGK